MATKAKTKVNSKGKTLYLSASGKSYQADNSKDIKTKFTNTAGQKVTVLKDGSKSYDGVFTQPTNPVIKPVKEPNTTGVTPNPKNQDMTEAGVISSEMGETQMKQYQSDGQKLEVGNGTKESPFSDLQIQELESQGIVEGTTVAGKGKLAPGGYWVNDVPPPKDTAEQPSATYIDPETGATTTTTGASAGSQEEQNKMKEKGMSLSESTTTAEDLTDPEIKKAEDEYIALEKEITSYKNKLVDLIISDADLKADLRGIRKAYDARIAEMRNITDRQVQSVKTLGYRMGMQFTGGMGGVMGGVISNAEQEGLLKIAEIEGMKESKIIEAKAAARDHNYKIYASLMEDARALSSKKAAEVANLKQAQKEQDALIAKQKKQIENDTLVADLFHQGFTSADEIVNQLNVNPDGSLNYRITLEEAEKALKVLNPPDALKGLDSDYQTFAYLQKIGDPSVAGMKWTDYQRMMANLKQKSITPIDNTKELEKLSENVQEGMNELMKGATWASVWNRLYTQYRSGDPTNDAALGQYLDLTLDKGTWAKEGAYQNFNPQE